ncbi:hypothetical protein Tco_0227280 [Tanacetum coccineum]
MSRSSMSAIKLVDSEAYVWPGFAKKYRGLLSLHPVFVVEVRGGGVLMLYSCLCYARGNISWMQRLSVSGVKNSSTKSWEGLEIRNALLVSFVRISASCSLFIELKAMALLLSRVQRNLIEQKAVVF